jgi:hypothetical protein
MKLMFLLGSGDSGVHYSVLFLAFWLALDRGGTVAYTQARKSKTKGTRYVGYYLDAYGKPKVAGTFATDDEALH